MRVFKAISAILVCVFVYLSIQTHAQVINVKDYGAKGDGVMDDTQSIIDALTASLEKENAQVYFPNGTYIVEKTIDVFLANKRLTVKGQSQAGTKIKCRGQHSIFSFRGQYSSVANGVLRVEKISLEGDFPAFSDQHPFAGKRDFFFGIKVSDMDKVTIEKVNIANIYGMGIYIHLTKYADDELNARFSNVLIKSCRISNVWGFNPDDDDYGDGIYLAGVAKAEVSNNEVYNDLSATRQFGRAGIVVEYLCSNINVKRNNIFGYDRAMHLEDDFGGHVIEHNKMSGSDMGVVFYNKKTATESPVYIRDNHISNKGLPKNNSLTRTRGSENDYDRSLLTLFVHDDARKGSVIENNTIEIDLDYDYYSSSIANLYVEGLLLRRNTFRVLNPEKFDRKINYNDFSKQSDNQNNLFINIWRVNVSDQNPNHLKFQQRNVFQKSQLGTL